MYVPTHMRGVKDVNYCLTKARLQNRTHTKISGLNGWNKLMQYMKGTFYLGHVSYHLGVKLVQLQIFWNVDFKMPLLLQLLVTPMNFSPKFIVIVHMKLFGI